NDEPYASLLSRQYDMVTPENEMKWATTQPRRFLFVFGPGDSIVDFAERHAIAVRGHNLVWERNNPAWLNNRHFDGDQLMSILHDHIRTLVGHYRGRIAQWDVINEGLGGDGSLQRGLWLQGIGPDYIEMAFRWAHEADPAAKLFYNDAELEF